MRLPSFGNPKLISRVSIKCVQRDLMDAPCIMRSCICRLYNFSNYTLRNHYPPCFKGNAAKTTRAAKLFQVCINRTHCNPTLVALHLQELSHRSIHGRGTAKAATRQTPDVERGQAAAVRRTRRQLALVRLRCIVTLHYNFTR